MSSQLSFEFRFNSIYKCTVSVEHKIRAKNYLLLTLHLRKPRTKLKIMIILEIKVEYLRKKIVIKTIFKENLLQNILQLKTKFIELNYDM